MSTLNDVATALVNVISANSALQANHDPAKVNTLSLALAKSVTALGNTVGQLDMTKPPPKPKIVAMPAAIPLVGPPPIASAGALRINVDPTRVVVKLTAVPLVLPAAAVSWG